MKILIFLLLLVAGPLHAKMQTFLRGPDFDWDRIETITTTIHLSQGVDLLRVEFVQTGCILLIVPGSGVIVDQTELCGENDKYYYERTPSN